MKKCFSLILCICALLITLSGCKKEENITFTATIKEVYHSSILVSTDDDVGFDAASVDISGVEPDFNLIKGQTVFLTIAPLIRETYPAGVTAVAIELVAESYLTGTPIPSNTNSEIEGVSMSIEYGSVTSKGLTVVIRDENGSPYTYGEWYELMVFDGEAWEEAPIVIEGDYGFNDIGLFPKEDGTLTLNINWEWLYGNLESGKYKIVKALYFPEGYKYFSAEFEIS